MSFLASAVLFCITTYLIHKLVIAPQRNRKIALLEKQILRVLLPGEELTGLGIQERLNQVTGGRTPDVFIVYKALNALCDKNKLLVVRKEYQEGYSTQFYSLPK